MRWLLTIYIVGVILGMIIMRDRWPLRIVTALVWPLGPIAFVVVTTILLMAAAILWPIPVLGTAAVLGGAAWLFS